jgi:DNA invertase Pin-like site-specific DNA recombinase
MHWNARAEGRRLGRPRQQHVNAGRTRELRAQGFSLRAVARTLSVHRTAVSRALGVA